MWGGAAGVSFFHWAIQLHPDCAPMKESGSHLQKDECRCLTSCCIGAQKPWQRKPNLIWKKKAFEFHLPVQSSALFPLPPTSLCGITACQDRLHGENCLCLGPQVLLFVLLNEMLTADITHCCCTLRLYREGAVVLGEVVVSRVCMEG